MSYGREIDADGGSFRGCLCKKEEIQRQRKKRLLPLAAAALAIVLLGSQVLKLGKADTAEGGGYQAEAVQIGRASCRERV